MTAAITSTETRPRCLAPRCGRILRSAKSVSLGYGPVCARKIRKAAEDEVFAGASPKVAEKARQLIADKGIVPARRPGVYEAVSLDGARVYRCTARACTCEAGCRGKYDCNHELAARALDIAALPPATLTAPRRVFTLPAPTVASDDIWAALAAVGALDPIPAF